MQKAPPLVFFNREFCEFVEPTEGEVLIGTIGRYYMAMWLQMWSIDTGRESDFSTNRFDL